MNERKRRKILSTAISAISDALPPSTTINTVDYTAIYKHLNFVYVAGVDAGFVAWQEHIEKNRRSKQVNRIKNGLIVKTYDSIVAAAKDIDVHKDTMKNIIKNKREYYGFYYKFNTK